MCRGAVTVDYPPAERPAGHRVRRPPCRLRERYAVAMPAARRPTVRSLLRPLFFLSLAGAVAGCTPVTVSFTLFGDGERLTERVVAREDQASWKIAVIDVEGLIVDARAGGLLLPGGNPLDAAVSRLEMAREDRGVRAVVLRVNSPGGSVTASDVLHREITRFRSLSGKPLVVSMAEVAASGGLYVSLAADHIVANPTTITGSIGVIIPTINFSDGLRRIGIVARSVRSGPNKDIANSLEPAREPHFAILQGLVDEFHENFRNRVRTDRPRVDMTRFDEMTDGRVFSGREALAMGLVDSLGGVREAIEQAKALAGLRAAKIVKYAPEGGSIPKSPYASADVGPASLLEPVSGRGGAGTEFNFIQLNTAGAGVAPSATSVYYLWLPDLP